MQDGIYFDGEGAVVEALLSDEQRKALADGTLGTPAPAPGPVERPIRDEAHAFGGAINFKKAAAVYRAFTENEQAQFRALTHLMKADDSSALSMENASLKKENDRLADIVAELRRAANPTSAPAPSAPQASLVNESVVQPVAIVQGPPPGEDEDDGVPARPSAPVLHGGPDDADDDGPPMPSAPVVAEPVDKPAEAKPTLDLVGWLKGQQKDYRVMEVSNYVKSVYGFRGNKAAIIAFLVDEKNLVAPGEVAIS